jgi:hypothetical protein
LHSQPGDGSEVRRGGQPPAAASSTAADAGHESGSAPGNGRVRAGLRHAVTARAVIAGLILTPLNVFFIVKATVSPGGFRFTGRHSLFVNTISVLLVLVLTNQWLKRRRPAWALGAGEMLTVYLMLGMSTGLISSAFDLGGALATTITYPFWFATAENKWQELLWPNMPTWLTVQDRDVVAGFYLGHSTPYTWDVIRAWATPAIWFAVFIGVVTWVCLCMNSIVRRRWEDEERLPFPITTLPVHMVDERTGLLQNRLWWTGLGIALGLGVWNTIAGLFPSLPSIPLAVDYSSYVANHPPWNFMRWSAFEWQPFALGLCYLIPLDLAFSLFVFDLFWTAEYVLSGHLGWSISEWSGFPYGDQQTAGGFIALLLAAAWLDRKYLREVLRRALGLESTLREDGREAFSYRFALVGALAGMGFIWWFLMRGNVQASVALAFVAIYFPTALVISRLRAQLGPPTHQLGASMPSWILPALAGTRTLGPRTMGMFAALSPFLQEQRNNPTPLQLEAFKMAEGGRMERRRIALALAVVPPLAILCYFWAAIHVGYHVGMASSQVGYYPYLHVPRLSIAILDDAVRYPSGTDTSSSLAMGFGLVSTLLLLWLKLQFQWWPLHPVAFPIALASTVQALRLAIFATWLCKALLLRYGGLRAHRRALPFFLGLLAGGAGEAMLRRCLSMLLGVDLSFMAT